ncbi:SprT family zinc-dependent metalloprotease [Avibacterium paragallinarum]|uniref:Protein SprT n=2 Tax=Avibacterium paragallinarum TaxID=728 RepID=A0A8B3TAS5_AVIPA|nr:SprT family zinc-dependent metalloprotease [Avibacterium paragallinarum]KAA6209682.1 SprT family zinc-dependent metalloprotease [Avibacterium paragallinarum]RZN59978.1 SprT family zinc-dependent metalloprotease [Avibacterium paragallinarum]RZN73154.1 SprT family zinc-dependent metalloprotease [Avibacterium paragallinarum]
MPMLEKNISLRLLNIQILRQLRHYLKLAEQHFQRSFPMPEVNYQLRGLKAGVAYLQKNEIRFNRTLLLENPDYFLQQIVPHELAHLIVYQVFGRVSPHGKEWKAVMEKLFNLPAEIYHCLDVQSVQGKTFPYQCACQIHNLSLRRHNRVQNQSAEYFCKQCKEKLMLKKM